MVLFSPFQPFSVGLFGVFSRTSFASNVDAPPYSCKKHKPTVILFMYLIMCNSYFNTREKCRSVGGKKTYCLKKFSAWKSDENKDFAEVFGKIQNRRSGIREWAFFGSGIRENEKNRSGIRESTPPWGGASFMSKLKIC